MLVPLVALVGLWGYAIHLTISNTLQVNLLAQTDAANHMATGKLFDAIQQERRASMVYLGSGRGTAARGELTRRQRATDTQAAAFRRVVTDDVLAKVEPADRIWLTTLRHRLTGLAAVRRDIMAGAASRSSADTQLTRLTTTCLGVFTMMTTDKNPNFGFYHQSLAAFQRAREALSEEDALVAGALAAGGLTDTDYRDLVQRVDAQRALFSEAATTTADPTLSRRWHHVTASSSYRALHAMEDQAIDRGRGHHRLPFTAVDWASAGTHVFASLHHMERADYNSLVAHATPVVTDIILNLAAMILLGLLLVVLVVVCIRRTAHIGGSLNRRLRQLQRTLLHLAEEWLPSVMDRLRRGEDVDVAVEAPPVAVGSDEVGQLGYAFNLVQQSALKSAAEAAGAQAAIRRIVLTLAQRNQSLLQRQLALLDAMQRGVEDPDELERLFQIDHLTTRMRRHAEDLITLYGAPPARRWRKPVSGIAVIRGAIQEVEKYTRVKLTQAPDTALLGHVATDVSHLLAELVENATAYSPPHTTVHVSGELVPHGLAIEIEDRGLGIDPEQLAEINTRLAEPLEVQALPDTAHLGLFVVSQFAHRHGIKVHLRPSPYGGITSIVLLPNSLLATDSDQPAALQPASADEQPTATVRAGPSDPPSPASIETTGLPPHRHARQDLEPRPAERPTPPAVASEPVAASRGVPNIGVPAGAGLPQRERGTHLAPRLRAAPQPPAAPTTMEPPPRPPEEVRARYTGLQRGTRQGRTDSAHLTAPDGPQEQD